MARIYWGPSGREREGRAYQVHPSEPVFLIAEGDLVSYEVEILRGIEPRLRAQIIATADAISIHASVEEDFARLTTASRTFLGYREIMVQKRCELGPQRFRVAVVGGDADFRIARIELRPRPAAAWLDRFPVGMPGASDPRLYEAASHRPIRWRLPGCQRMES